MTTALDEAGDLSVGVTSYYGDVVIDDAGAAGSSKTQPLGGGDLGYMPVAFFAVVVGTKRRPPVQVLSSLTGRYVQIAGVQAAIVSKRSSILILIARSIAPATSGGMEGTSRITGLSGSKALLLVAREIASGGMTPVSMV